MPFGKEPLMNVGVIGAGIISEIYLKNMTRLFPNLTVLGVAARHPERARARASQFGIRAYTVEELLADPQVELVVILTPVGTHYDLIRRALLAGKHVYTEKTLADSLDKARQLCALAEETGLCLGSAPDTFLGSALQCARQAVDRGLLGKINSFAISVHRNNSYLLSRYPFLLEPGAGVLLDFCVYHVTALASLFGPFARVGGIVSTPYPTHACTLPGPDFGKILRSPNESQVSAVLQTRSGVTGTLHLDAESSTRGEPFFTLYGTEGILRLPDPNRFGGQVLFCPNSPEGEQPPIALPQTTPYRENSRGVGPAEMAQAIAEGRSCRPSKEMALHVLEVLTTLLEVGKTGGFGTVATDFSRPAPLPEAGIGGP